MTWFVSLTLFAVLIALSVCAMENDTTASATSPSPTTDLSGNSASPVGSEVVEIDRPAIKNRTAVKTKKSSVGRKQMKADPFSLAFPQVVLQQILDGKPIKVTFEQENKIVFQRKQFSGFSDQETKPLKDPKSKNLDVAKSSPQPVVVPESFPILSL